MNRSIPQPPSNNRVFCACLLSFMILIAPIASMAAATLRATAPAVVANKPATGNLESSSFEPAAAMPAAVPVPAPAPMLAVGPITATKSDTFPDPDGDGKAELGEIISYTVGITNTGTDPAPGVTFNDDIDANTTFVPNSMNVSPLAFDDAYSAVGNTLLEVGNATTQTGPQKSVAGGVLDNGDTEFLGDTFTISAFDATSTNGGTVTMVTTGVDAGAFTYISAANFTGTDTFTYTLRDDGTDSIAGNSDDLTGVGTVTITVANQVWYVDDSAGPGGDGRSTTPFDSLADVSGGADLDDAGDIIYVFSGTYTTGVTLENTQTLHGAGTALIVGADTLAGAGAAPTITNAAGSGVTLASGNTLTGFTVGNTTVADITDGGATVGSLTITNVTLTGSGAAVDIDQGGTLAVTFNSIASSGAGQAIDLGSTTGVSGSFTVTGTTVIDDATTDGIAISNSSVTATFTGVVTILNDAGGANGDGVDLSTNSGTYNFNGGISITVNGAAAFGFRAQSSGTVNILNPGGTNQITSNNGTALLINPTTLNANLTSLTSGGGTEGISLNGMSGSLTIGTVSINGQSGDGIDITSSAGSVTINGGSIGNTNDPAGIGVDINAGAGNVTISATINKTTAGEIVEISGRTGGVVDFNGNLTSNTAGGGVDLTTNTGATINFKGGMILSTGANPAFTATGGGTVSVCDENPCVTAATGPLVNTLTTTTGTALNVANTFLGVTGLTFQSINVNGATNGIILNTVGTTAGTNGGLTVTGTGTTDGSGGTIQNNVQGALITSTRDLVLKNMNFTNANSGNGTCNNIDGPTFNDTCQAAINMNTVTTATFDNLIMDGGNQVGINGRTVSTLQILNSTVRNFGDAPNENDVRLFNLTGTCAITNSDFSFATGDATAGETLVDIRNNTGTLTLDVKGNPLGTNFNNFTNTQDSANGSIGLSVTGVSTSLITVNVQSSKFLEIKTVGIATFARDDATMNVNITGAGTVANGNTFDPTFPNLGRAIDLNAEDTADLNFNINENPKIYGTGGPVVNIFGINNAQINGHIRNNPDMRNRGVPTAVGSIIFFHPEDSSDGRVHIHNNSLSGSGQDQAILLLNHGNGAALLDAVIDGIVSNNTISLATADGTNSAIYLNSGANAGDLNKVCGYVHNNAVTTVNAGDFAFVTFTGSAGSNVYLQNFSVDITGTWTTNGNTETGPGGTAISGGSNPPLPAAGNPPFNGTCRAPTNAVAMLSPVNGPGAVPTYAKRVSPSAENTMALWTGLVLANDDRLPTILQSARLNQMLTTDGAHQSLLTANAAIAGKNNGSNQAASLSQLLAQARGYVSRFANSVDSLIVPTAHAETEKTEVRSQRSEVRSQRSEVRGQRSDVRLNHAKIRRSVPANAATSSRAMAPMPPLTPVSIGTLPGNKSLTVKFQVTVNTGLGLATSVSNQGNVTYTGGPVGGVPTDDQPGTAAPNEPTVTPISRLDVQVTKTDGVTSTTPGSDLTYTLTYTNNDHAANGVVLTETVPAGTTFKAAGSSVWTGCADGAPAGTVCTINLGTLPRNGVAGFTGTRTFVVTVLSPAAAGVNNIVNTATIADDGLYEADYIPANNTITDTDTLNAAPDLNISKTDGVLNTTPGSTLTYTVTYSNVGTQNATGVVLTETVPVGTTFTTTGSSAWTGCANGAPAGTVCTINVGNLTAGAAASIATFVVVVTNPAASGLTTIVDNASIADDGANGTDPTLPNTATDTDTLDAAPDLTISKVADVPDVAPGDTIVYTITYANAGNQNALGVVITETVPTHTTFSTADSAPTVWSCPDNSPAPTVCTTTIGGLTGGGSGGTVKFAVKVVDPTPPLATQISNTATIADDGGNGADPTPGNNTTTVITPILICTPPPPNMTNWWTGDNTTRDIAGGKDGSLENGATYGTGKVLQGFSLDGSDDYVGVGDVDLPSTFTIDAWVNPTNLTNEQAIVNKDSGVDRSYFFNITNTGALRALVHSGGGNFTQYQTAAGVVTAGSLQHVAVTYDGAAPANQKMLFYKNGVLVASTVQLSQDAGGTPENVALAARIGRSNDGSSAFIGVIDEVEFFSRVLSAAELNAIFTADSGGKCKPSDLRVDKSHSGNFNQNSTGNNYTITVHNDGPGITTGTTTVTDNLPAGLTATAMSGSGWTCPGPFPAPGPAVLTCTSTATIASGADFPAITLTVSVGTDTPSANNAVTVSGGGQLDTSDDSDSDPTTLTPVADLSITKTDGQVSEVPGTAVSYTIVVANNGPSSVTGATVADLFPAEITGVTYTSVAAGGATGNTASGAGNINDTVNMPSGSSITYTASGTISPSATVSLANTATVTAPGGTTDPNNANNTATDTDTLTVTADLSITKTDGQASEVPGTAVSYTIVVANNGPSSVTGATVADLFPAEITGVTYTSVAAGGATGNTASGAGNINDTVNMPSGSSITYTASGTISPSATVSLANTATVTAPGGTTDPNNANNTATDTDTLTVTADLSITKTDGQTNEVPGTAVSYTIVVTNNGPSNVTGATVADLFPAEITGVTYTSVAAGGATGNTASGAGNINDTVNMPSGSSITYTASGTISPSATVSLANTATVTAPGGTTDPNNANNTATDTDTLTVTADLSITKTDGQTNEVPGTAVSYTIVVTNNGPSNVTGATVADTFPGTITGVTYTSVAAGGATGNTAAGAGNINDTVNMPTGSTITYTATGTISSSATVSLSNTATVTAPGGVTDAGGNNSATDTDTLTPAADLSITKTDGATDEVPGTPVTYTITVTNAGPSDVTGATVADTFPATITGVTYTSVTSGGATGNTAAGSGNINDTINMPLGSSITYTATGTISSSATVSLSNTATVTAPGGVTDAGGNNSATDTDTLTPSADLSVTKSDSPDPAVVGGNLTYTVTVTNNGSSDAQNLSLSDTLPPNTTLVSFTVPAGWTRTDGVAVGGTGTVTATAPTLVAGGNSVFTLVVNVNLATPHNTVLTNSATVTTTTTDPNLVNNTGTAMTTVLATLALIVNDSGDAPDNNLGDRICDTNAAPGDQCTLRAAIQETNAAVTADTIDFNLPANTTITLLSALDSINGDLAINGPGADLLNVQRSTAGGTPNFIVFQTSGAVIVSISGLTISNGRNANDFAAGFGGGISMGGGSTLNLSYSTISGNTASAASGVYNENGTLNVNNSTFSGNSTLGGGFCGTIHTSSGTTTVVNSTFSGNTSAQCGSALSLGSGTLTITNSTITNNRSDSDGDAIAAQGAITNMGGGTITLRNTIVAGNFIGMSPGATPDDIVGTVAAGSNNNLLGTGGSGGLTNGVNNNQVGVVDARLAPLANNGGPTQTHALLAGSAALDAGDNTSATNAGLTTDQRGPGFGRIADGPDADAIATVEIGAFEAQVWVEDIADRSMNEDSTDSFSFNVGGSAAITSVTATSSNTALVPNNAANLNVSGAGSTRTLTITPLADQTGTTIITVTVNSASGSMTDTFVLTVNGVNDPPSFTKGPDQTVAEDSGLQTVPNWATNISPGPANESGQTVTFLIQNNTNPGLFSAGPAISSTGTLTYTPAANANGTATITIALMDNGGGTDTSPSQTFVITVTEVNDLPDAVNDLLSSVAEDSGQRTIPIASLLANDTKGPANENGQTLTFSLVGGSGVGGTVSSDATNVFFTPAADFNGTASFQYMVTDNGTTNGAPDPKNDTGTASFTVTEVNDAPTAVNDPLGSVAEDSGERVIPFINLTSNDLKGPANESGQSLIVKTVSNPIGGTVSIVAGTVRFTPTANFNGQASFLYTVEDNGTTNGLPDPKTSGTAIASFIVTPQADAPSVTNATTNANTQTTSGLVISRNPADGPEVTHFKITGITGGSLFKHDGVTPINNGDFITFAEGNAGLRFTPGTANGSFTVQASTSASDAGLQGGTATATITVNPLGGVIQFSAANYGVDEGAGFRTITVQRTGDASQAVTVDFASSDLSNPADFIPCNAPGAGFASSRCDFTTAIGTLRFEAGETSKTFNVLISQDNYLEGPETLDLTLSNPTGGAVLGAPATASVGITDDTVEGLTNPVDLASDFVRALYHDLLNREPDGPGLAFWTDNIEKCNDPARLPAGQTVEQCTDKQRESTAIAFFMSPELQMTGGFVYRLHKGSLTGAQNFDGGSPGRFPTFLEFIKDVSQVSEGIVVNNQIDGAVVEANRNQLAADFVQRPEFVAKYGGLDNTLYVQELFNTTGIAATAAEKQALVDGLGNGTETRASVLRKVVDGTVVISESDVQFTTTYGQAFYNQETRRVFVYMEYVGFLRRNPDSPGFVFWLGKLNTFNGDPFQAEMVRSFILSPEYRSRFGQP